MSFHTGVANSFTALQVALFSACAANGWTSDGNTLMKGAAYINVTPRESAVAPLGTGLVLTGATGLSGGLLQNPSAITPRLGAPHRTISPVTWPAEYFIHVFQEPDEVYLVLRFNVDYYLWLAFGVSDVPGLTGSGLWLHASSAPVSYAGVTPAISINSSGVIVNNGVTPAAFMFLAATNGVVADQAGTIASNFDGVLWAGLPNSQSSGAPQYMSALVPAGPRLDRTPSAWNGEAALIPIQGYVTRNAQKCSLALDLRNARYLRIDNYEAEQIITLGPDQWRVYPFYRRNVEARAGGQGVDHSGTFGWAIRYDGD